MPAHINDHSLEAALHEKLDKVLDKLDVVLPYLDKLHDKIDALTKAQDPSEPPKNE